MSGSGPFAPYQVVTDVAMNAALAAASVGLPIETANRIAADATAAANLANEIAARIAGDAASPSAASVAAALATANAALPKAGGSMSGAITVPSSGSFPQSAGAIIQRFGDRVFVGSAVVNDGNVPSSVKDYCETLFSPTTSLAQFAALSSVGGSGVLGSSRSSDNITAGSEGCIGVAGFAWNNNTSIQQTAYGGYFQAQAMPGLNGSSITQGLEVDVINQSGLAPVPVQPYLPYANGATYGIFSASGGGVAGVTDSSLGLLIGNNGAAFKTGIMFGSNAITGATGTSGSGVAIAMGMGHTIQWYAPNGTIAAQITSSTTTNTPAPVTQNFGNTGLGFYNSAGTQLFGLTPVNPAASGTSMFTTVNNNAGVNAVAITLGAADSGGTGFRSLRVPN